MFRQLLRRRPRPPMLDPCALSCGRAANRSVWTEHGVTRACLRCADELVEAGGEFILPGGLLSW